MKKLTVSKWIADNVNSHAIQDSEKLASNFKLATGHDACWPSYTMKQTRTAIRRRGLGGTLNGPENMRCSWGWQVAYALAEKFGSDKDREYRNKSGRGFIFRAAIESIEKAGN